ncbi:hypothetical protein QE152_g6468 [Popillia japonica]|uniref:Uncharacterized protein n=1 Tax=Popillia japonica TaxID=7064 RepID=A0AAW1MH42_POPJA
MGKAITDKEIGRLFGDAYIKAATIGVAIKGFASCGIEPYNPGVFSDVDFAPSTVTERHLLSQSEIPIEAQELSSDTGDSDNEPLANYKRRMIRHSTASPSTSKQNFHSPSSHTNLVGSASNEKLTPLSCQPCKKGNRKNLWEIRPLPTYNRPVTNRKRQKTSVITSTPVKLALEEMEQHPWYLEDDVEGKEAIAEVENQVQTGLPLFSDAAESDNDDQDKEIYSDYDTDSEFEPDDVNG